MGVFLFEGNTQRKKIKFIIDEKRFLMLVGIALILWVIDKSELPDNKLPEK